MNTLSQRDNPPVRPDENQGPTILAATLTVTIAALFAVIARLYVRLRMIRNVGWDDYVMVTSMILCIAGQCIIIPQVYYGAGRHIEYIEIHEFQNSFRLNFVTQPLYLFAICLTKLSVGFFLLRIAVQPFYKKLIIGIMCFMSFYTIGCFFTIVLQCTDLRVQWDQTVKGTCWSTKTLKSLSYSNQALNILTDVAFSVAIPIPMLWNVQMNRRQKASIIGILGLGMFATAAAVVKLSYVSTYGRSGDWLWDSRDLTIWTVIECNVAIIAGCLPCLKPLFRTVLGSTYGRGTRKTEPSKYISRPYGPGTPQRSRNYSELHSNKTADTDYKGYGGKDAYMLTTIGTEKHMGGDVSRLSSGRSSPNQGKDSSESIARLNSEPGFGGLGRIAVTTKVDVTESEIYDDRQRHGRPKAKEMV
ncbi:hypothetical protein JI435_045660 [Parastagonospora nodorum SN15]|uniref:Rhodopsin domain-containing protein n=1 Tax=Phaeosphaeria nodorum (strain SN15 / ATCC MYA-4574 / FGSC 10173) TaxID=321614 RepID=A0A7U2F551_PHANO|nr:hypothetical protein JI435_045660 [Parastagonospora nodorum SN15]